VTDLADAHVRAVRLLLDGAAGDVFNLGTESGTSVKEVIDAVGRACGRQVPHSIGPRRQGDPAVLIASAAKARRILGWAPRHSSIDRIVEDALKWFLKDRGVAAGDRPADAAASL
jgi:UDP-arabinose 4-epimerase